RRLVGAVDTVNRFAEVKRARAERIARAAGHETGQIRLTVHHLVGRRPVRPFGHLADLLLARPGETLASDPDAVADRLTIAENQVQIRVLRIDDQRAGGLFGAI